MKEEIRRLLEVAVQSYFRRGGRIARDWSPGPSPNLQRILAGSLGQDLQWLEHVANGDVQSVTMSEVAEVEERVLADLYTPLVGDSLLLPGGFENTPLGKMLVAAEARAVGTAAASAPIAAGHEIMADTPPSLHGETEEPARQGPSDMGRAGEWLLGEGTIRGVLYLGGLLVVAAATIFVVYNWGAFPGYLKFGTIFLTTLGLYLLGYTLYNTPLQVAGVTFIGIGSIVVPLNFYALYAFVMQPKGIPLEGAWILGSAFCCGLYLITAWWLRTSLPSYASLLALASLAASVQYALEAPAYVSPPVWVVLVGLLMLLAQEGEKRGLPEYLTVPFRRSSLLANPVLTLVLVIAITDTPEGSSLWSSILFSLVIAATNFGYHGHVSSTLWTRIATYLIVPFTYITFLSGIDLSRLATGAAVMALGILYLGVSFTSVFRSYGATDQWALRGIGYFLALCTTSMAVGHTQDLIFALLADVAVLAGSAYAYRGKKWWIVWAWGAVWLFMLPWLLLFMLKFPATLGQDFFGPLWSPGWSYGLALLCLNYLAVSVLARRWSISLAAGFVAAALLVLPFSALMVAIFSETIFLGVALFTLSVLAYLAVSLACRVEWLLYPSLLLVNITVWVGLNAILSSPRITSPITIGSYVGISLVQLYLAWFLERKGLARWSYPVYAWAALNMSLSFVDAVYAALAAGAAIGFRIRPHTGLGQESVNFVIVSILYAAALFHFAWLQRQIGNWHDWLGKTTITFIALAVLAGAVDWAMFDTGLHGHHYAAMAVWLLLGVLIGRSLPPGDLYEIYGRPLQNFGIVAIWPVLILALFVGSPLPTVTAYIMGSLVYWHQAFDRRSRGTGYVAGFLMAVAYASLLRWQNISEPQTYAIPFSVAFLYAGHLEREGREHYLAKPMELSWLFTWSGLLLAYSVSLAQSLEGAGAPYLALLLAEALAGLLWGLRVRSRSWVLLSSGFLVGAAVLHLIDDIVALPAWVLLGSAGTILLVVGVLALARRQELLLLGQAAAKQWDAWRV